MAACYEAASTANKQQICFFSCAAKAAQPAGSTPGSPTPDWHKEFVTEADAEILEHSGKMMLLFEILRMAEEVEEKV